MSEMRLNQRQQAVLRILFNEAQQAQAASNTAQGKILAFMETIKAQFDLPTDIQNLKFEDDGTISFEVSAPAPPSDLPPAHPMIEGVKAMLGAQAAVAGSGLKIVDRPIEVQGESAPEAE